VNNNRLLNISASFFIILSMILMLLPLDGSVGSFRNLLSYVFIPQIKGSNYTYDYSSGVAVRVKQLINAHQENEKLKEEMKSLMLNKSQTDDIQKENQRLASILGIKNKQNLNGVWARATYKEPSRWNTVIIDKGEKDGLLKNSAVIGINNTQVGLVGKIIEVNKDNSKVLLITDKEFSVACSVGKGNWHGLLEGSGDTDLEIKYVPINAGIIKGEDVFTSNLSAVFREGIKIGTISEVESGGGEFKTFLHLKSNPLVNIGSLKEVFVLTGK